MGHFRAAAVAWRVEQYMGEFSSRNGSDDRAHIGRDEFRMVRAVLGSVMDRAANRIFTVLHAHHMFERFSRRNGEKPRSAVEVQK